MPVSGLPATLEVSLTSLLQENTISSWKIVAEGAKTTVVLRLCDNNFDPNMAASNAQGTVNKLSYRRKPPSQQRRDFNRANDYRKRNNQLSNLYNKDDCAFQSTSTAYFSGIRPTYHEERDSDIASVGLSTEDPGDSAAQNSEAVSSSDLVTQAAQAGSGLDNQLFCENGVDTATCFDIELNDIKVSTDQVKEYIDSLKDKSIPSKLKNKRRNNRFRKCALDNSVSPPTMLCESEDFVISVETEAKVSNDIVVYWLIKQSPRSLMLDEELQYLSKLEQGMPADRGKFWRTKRKAEDFMKNTRDLAITYYD